MVLLFGVLIPLMRAHRCVQHRRRQGGGCNRENRASLPINPDPSLDSYPRFPPPRLSCPPGAPTIAPVAFFGGRESLQPWEIWLLFPVLPLPRSPSNHPLICPPFPSHPSSTLHNGPRPRPRPHRHHRGVLHSLDEAGSAPMLLATQVIR